MAMAIADASHVIDEVWFVAEGSVVKILNFAGTVKGNDVVWFVFVIADIVDAAGIFCVWSHCFEAIPVQRCCR